MRRFFKIGALVATLALGTVSTANAGGYRHYGHRHSNHHAGLVLGGMLLGLGATYMLYEVQRNQRFYVEPRQPVCNTEYFPLFNMHGRQQGWVEKNVCR